MATQSQGPKRGVPTGAFSAPAAIRKHFTEGDLTWVDVIHPTREEVHHLAEHYGFHPLHREDVLSRIQRPKLDDNDDEEYAFLVLHFPVFDEIERLSVISEVNVFVGADFVITFHDGRLRPLRRLAQTAGDERGSALLLGRGSGFLLYRLDEKLDAVEEAMFKDNSARTVQELSYLRRDIIALRRIIRPNIPVVRMLAGREREFLRLDEEAYYGDLVDGLNRAWDMLEEQKEIIEGLDATLSSLTSHRINQEMKLFTLISVILGPMTLISGILGMNVIIPFAEAPWAMPLVLFLMLGVGVAVFLYFRSRRMV